MKPKPPAANSAERAVMQIEPEWSEATARNFIRVFIAMLSLILMSEIVGRFTESKASPVEAMIRSGFQWLLSNSLNEGNRLVHLGGAGWLYEQREIDRLTQAKHSENEWHGRLLTLASQLKADDKSLMVVVVPGRLSLYPEQIRSGRYAGPVRATGEAKKLAALSAAGIDVMDMTDALWEFRDRQQVFFAQDSHWTPEAMKAVVLAVNKRVREKFPRLASNETPIINATIIEHADEGDLARKLEPLNARNLMGEEVAELISITGIEPNAKSPIVLHGDSLMRVFDDPHTSFGGGGKSPRAGFSTQLAMLLGRSLDVRGLPRDDDSYEDKKLVICLLPMTELVP